MRFITKVASIIVLILVSLFFSSQVYGLTEGQKKKVDDLAGADRVEEAKKLLERYLKSDPTDADVHYKLGGLYGQMGQKEDAVKEYQKTLEQDPLYYEAYYPIWDSQLEAAKEDTDKINAKKLIDEKLASMISLKTPTDKIYALAYYVYNTLLEDKDKRDDVLKRLLAEYPKSKELNDVGQEEFENILKESDRAKRIPFYEIYIKNFPNHSMTDTAYRGIISYYWKDCKPPDKDKIKEYAGRWVEQRPASVVALRTSARVLAELDMDLDNAVKWAKECVNLVKKEPASNRPVGYDEWQCPNDIRLYEALDTLGWAYLKSGNNDEAGKYLSAAIVSNDFDNRIWYHMGKLYEKSGKPMIDILRAYQQALICRDDIPEMAESVKNLYRKQYPDIEAVTLDLLYKNLNQTFAQAEGLPYFSDITARSGLDKTSARRVAWGDYNNDGYQDLLLDGCSLYRNKGDGTFEDVTLESNITGGYSGGIWADFNNDSFLDFFSSGAQDALWYNNGDGIFTNITEEANPKLNDGYTSEGAAWGDYNRDGFVDLYIANYEGPFAVGNPDFLWKNVKGKTFADATAEAKVVPDKNRCGRGVVWGDYNNDGWLDIMVSNYRLNPNFLWKNNGNGTFTDTAKETGAKGVPNQGYFGHSIGSDFADYNNDGNLDLFVANLSHPRYITFSNMSNLLQNSGTPDYRFKDLRKESGIRFEETHSDPAWIDFDNDGLLDLYITSVYPERPSFLYKQDKKGRFVDVTWLTGTRIYDGWGQGWADFDNDGDLDLLVCGTKRGDNKGSVYLFRNEAISKDSNSVGRNFLEIELIGKDCNHAGIGARIVLESQNLKQMREVKGGRGTTSQDSLVQHFGLGNYGKQVALTIKWPCGRTEQLQVNPNQLITISETE